MSHDKFEEHIRKTLSGHASNMDTNAFWAGLENKRKKRRRFLFFWLPIGFLVLGLSTFAWFYNFTSPDTSGLAEQVETNIGMPAKDQPDNEAVLITGRKEDATADGSTDQTARSVSEAGQSAPAPPLQQTKKEVPKSASTTNSETVVPEFDTEIQATLSPKGTNSKEPAGATDLAGNPEEVFQPQTRNAVQADPLTELSRLLFEIDFASDFAQKPQAIILFEKAEVFPKRKTWETWIGFHAGIGAAIDQLSGTPDSLGNNALLDARQQAEKSLEVLFAGADFYLMHRKGFGIRTGLEFQQFAQQLTYEESNIEYFTDPNGLVRVYEFPDGSQIQEFDSIQVSNQISRNVVHYNYFRFLEIPVALRYEFPSDSKLGLFLEGGASLNVWKSATGKTIDQNTLLPEFIGEANQGADWFRNALNPEAFAGLGLNYIVSDEFEIWMHPQVKYRFGNVANPDYPLEQKLGSFSLQLGVRWKLN
ncbi:MAG: hypothetical protein KDC34_04560 [Saprospiraceae bacterium]|nr:hypothetical protein [Saprospiraceae bacterium]